MYAPLKILNGWYDGWADGGDGIGLLGTWLDLCGYCRLGWMVVGGAKGRWFVQIQYK